MSVKNKMLIGIIALGINIPVVASAVDLVIINNTNYDSTSILNHGPCSDILGENGVSYRLSTNRVPDHVITKACIFHRNNCIAEIHMSKNCAGPAIATVVFDVNTGIKSVTMHSSQFRIVHDSFAAKIDEVGATSWLLRLFR